MNAGWGTKGEGEDVQRWKTSARAAGGPAAVQKADKLGLKLMKRKGEGAAVPIVC